MTLTHVRDRAYWTNRASVARAMARVWSARKCSSLARHWRLQAALCEVRSVEV